jgi:poly(3-hydroxybutyrate) depolymerase
MNSLAICAHGMFFSAGAISSGLVSRASRHSSAERPVMI